MIIPEMSDMGVLVFGGNSNEIFVYDTQMGHIINLVNEFSNETVLLAEEDYFFYQPIVRNPNIILLG